MFGAMRMNLTPAMFKEKAVGVFPGPSTPARRQAWKWICFIGFIVVTGCGTTDTRNTDSKPWNRPTKADVSQSWSWPELQQRYWNSPGDHYP